MEEVDRFPVEGNTPEQQNGRLASKIGDKSYKIETIKRHPHTGGGEGEEWVILGDW